MDKIILSIAAATLLIGCSRKENPFFVDKINPKRAELKIVTKQFTGTPPRWKETFHEGDEIGLYLLSGDGAHFYADSLLYKNVRAKAVKKAGGNLDWKINPPIYLTPDPVTLIAYFPYRPQGHFPPDQLPLHVAALNEHTPDYRYGRSTPKQKRLNSRSPIAHLVLKPALAYLSFRVRLEKKAEKEFRLEAIQIENKIGTSLSSRKAFLELNTGRITPAPSAAGATRLTTEKARLSSDHYKEYQMGILPTFRRAASGEIQLLFTIDQHTHIASFPDRTHWKQGYRYVYEIIFNGKVLSLKPIRHESI